MLSCNRLKKILVFFAIIFSILISSCWSSFRIYYDDPVHGIEIGELDGVKIFGDPYAYPKGIGSELMEFQCVEYVKRYHYRKTSQMLPYIQGDYAKYVINQWDGDCDLIARRNNKTDILPTKGDIIVFDAKKYVVSGHVATISKVDKHNHLIYFAQQNVPKLPFDKISYNILKNGTISASNYLGMKTLGWLTREKPIFKVIDCDPFNNEQLRTNQPIMIRFSNKISDEIRSKLSDCIFLQQANQPIHNFKCEIVKDKVLVIKPSDQWQEGKLHLTIFSKLKDEHDQQLEDNLVYSYNVKKFTLVSTGPDAKSKYYKKKFPTISHHPSSYLNIDSKGNMWYFAGNLLKCIHKKGKKIREQTKLFDLIFDRGYFFNFRGNYCYILVKAHFKNSREKNFCCIVFKRGATKAYKLIKFSNDFWRNESSNIYHKVRSTIDKNGNLFFTDNAWPVQHIRKISPYGNIVKKISNQDFPNVSDFIGIACDANNNIYTITRMEYEDDRRYSEDTTQIYIFDNNLNLKKVIKGCKEFGGIYIDKYNDLYVTRNYHWEKYQITSNGLKFICKYSCPGSANIITVDSNGNVYVSNTVHVYKYIPIK